ncbi:MAG: hypothetical protein KAI24_25705 [Planctomycetes bacterium]|nr:hypothetical protein [Planctomycetota bacterium]
MTVYARLAALLTAALLAAAVTAQPSPQLTDVNRYADGSCGGVLEDEAWSAAFCLEVTKYRAELWLGADRAGRDGARRLVPTSDEAQAFVRRLQAWAEGAFGDEERAHIEAAADVSHRGSGWTFDRYKQAAVVNRLALYRRIHGAQITQVFEGRGTVRVSFKVRDGLGEEQLVLFRTIEGARLRMHFGDDVEPVAFDSPEERFVLQAMRVYVERRIPERGRRLMWQGAKVLLTGVPQDALALLMALIDYSRATFPRLANTLRVKDGGSIIYALVDAQARPFEVKFDKAIGSDTIGRIYHREADGEWALVAFGSDLEDRLLRELGGVLPRIDERARSELTDRLDRYRELSVRRRDR